MLDHAQLLLQLQKASDQLFIDYSHELMALRKLWQQLCQDGALQYKLQAVPSQLPVPTWNGALDAVTHIEPLSDYRVFSIDGSQIYPDKHQGTNCFLINTGLVDITYGSSSHQKKVTLSNKPQLFIDADSNEHDFVFSTELVNCRRQEYELQEAVTYTRTIASEHMDTKVFLFDGSLIFWHLDSKDIQLKHTFLSCYLMLMHQLFELKMPMAGYISLPKSKELVNIVRIALEGHIVVPQEPLSCDHIVDSSIAHFFLEPGFRTAVFKNNTSISNQYPDHLRPHFFYLHVGQEIGRVEIPAWVAQDEKLVNTIAAVILDQSNKGNGYPVALAEAHEQAVIKGPDREFFYHLIYKIAFEHKQKFLLSQKSIKKRGIGI